MILTSGPGGMMFCTCPAYRYRGAYGEKICKHINAVLLKGCFYRGLSHTSGPNTLREQFGIKIVDGAKNETTESCPGCGQLMIDSGRVA